MGIVEKDQVKLKFLMIAMTTSISSWRSRYATLLRFSSEGDGSGLDFASEAFLACWPLGTCCPAKHKTR